MGNERSSEYLATPENPNRLIFVSFESFRNWPAESYSRRYDSFIFIIKYQRYYWTISKRFSEILSLDSRLAKEFPEKLERIKCPRKYRKIFWTHNEALLTRRANDIVAYLQTLLDDQEIFESHHMKEFLEIGQSSLRPELGRKGKEGYLQKCSGGYLENYSSRPGDFIKTWQTRWFVLHDNYIAYYKSSKDSIPQGSLNIDQKFQVTITGRVVTISNRSRKLTVFAPTMKAAIEWAESLNQFYQHTPRRLPQPFAAHFPPRPNSQVKLFCCGKEYFSTLAIALLRAQEEILIASWMVSPTLLLTRPPLPPLRLDQILRFKAEQGVKIYVLLYKEVEMSGTGNDSLKCRNYLKSLHPTNICPLRHPNKLIGGSTAILWSHHEKLVIIDRKIGFVGGIDPCFGRWDDDKHRLTDEDGIYFPGKDYYQPARGLFKPINDLEVSLDENEDFDEMKEIDEVNNNLGNDERDDVSEIGGYCPSELNDDVGPVGGSPDSEKSWIGEEKSQPNNGGKLFNLMKKNKETNTKKHEYTEEEKAALGDTIPGAPSQSVIDLSVFDEVDENEESKLPNTQTLNSRNSITNTSTNSSTISNNNDSSRLSETAPRTFSISATRVITPGTISTNSNNLPLQSLPQQRVIQATVINPPVLPQIQQSQPRPPQQFVVVGQVVQQNVITNGVIVSTTNYPAPPPPTLTAEALAANSIQYEGSNDNISQAPKHSDIQSTTTSTTLYAKQESRSREYSLGLPLRSLVESIQSLSEGMTVKLDKPRVEKKKIDEINVREFYPRMPWHDVHGCITGLPVRDLSSHFIQRWNHHRVSKSAHDSHAALIDITDNPYHSTCAKCNLTNIFETITRCPNCGYDLGPAHISLSPTKNEINLKSPQDFVSSYITYNCYFSGQLGCRIQGDGPSLVTLITDPDTIRKIIPGQVIESVGEDVHIQDMLKEELRPIVGDILVSIEDVTVLHLNSIEVQRYIKRLKLKWKKNLQKELSDIPSSESMSVSSSRSTIDRKIKVVFRRHYVNNVEDIIKHDQQFPQELQKSQSIDLKTSTHGNLKNSPSQEIEEQESIQQLQQQQQSSTISQFLSSKISSDIKDSNQARTNLVCRACTSREVCKLMVDAEKQILARGDVIPNTTPLSGTCQVQVLRSVGPWSLGQSPETSIHNAWVHTIQQAQHFIYIENQFFIGDLAGTDVKNSIARAILDRVVLAAHRKESFKAIIVVPVHPEGDYVGSSGPLGVMNYQYKTINRGGTSFIEQFQKHTRGQINPLDYFCFCSLRNWGELDGKLVLDQIYVHDKLLIVDDRVMIMGSANVNDRSMLGERDTEVAIRIEDTSHYMGKMGGKPWVVGAVPHMFRRRLMGKHIGDYHCDLTDPICDEVYRQKWLCTARENTGIYYELDGPCSYDKCNTLEEYAKAILEKPHLNSSDPLVESFLARIKGHLVMFPLRFLLRENLKSLAHSTVLPDELFA